MKPRERRETGAQDLFRSRLDQIINLKHALVTLSKTVSWSFIEGKCGEVYTDGPGMPPLPTRLMADFRSSNTPLISPAKSCATAGLRILTFNTSAGQGVLSP
jgi:hypothetical protein